MIVERYSSSMAGTWDRAVRASRNGTFLHERAYMDYHADRFDDQSFLVYAESDAPLLLLPAHADGPRLGSHDGLSFAGALVAPDAKLPTFLQAFESLLVILRDLGYKSLDYKAVPTIYHRQPAEDDRYALFLLGATLIRRDGLSVVPREQRLPWQLRRMRGSKKAQGLGVRIGEERALGPFWDLVTLVLRDRFASAPVHTLEEITQLHERFPDNIRLFTARSPGEDLLAGVLVYETPRVAHAQYIAASPAGRDVAALDLLFDGLLNDVYRDHPYFDFGSSHEEGGQIVNAGLIEHKEGYGARTVTFDCYRIDLGVVRPGILTEALR